MNAPVALRDIPGFTGYAATADGRIWSKPRRGHGGWYRGHAGMWLQHVQDHRRYARVRLWTGGTKTYGLVHRLVALAWVPNPLNLPQVNHINGTRRDNRAANLEWCTQSANMLHAWRTGLQVFTPAMRAAVSSNARALNRTKRALDAAEVINIRRRVAAGELQYKIAREKGVTPMVVSRIITGRSYVDCR